MALVTDREAPKGTALATPEPLFEAAKVKIVGGMSEYALDNPPAIGEERTYIVKARCKKHETDRVDGEDRLIVQMEHTSIYERGHVPIVDEQPALFGESDAERETATPTDEGDSVEDPAELVAAEPELPDEDAGQRASMFSDTED